MLRRPAIDRVTRVAAAARGNYAMAPEDAAAMAAALAAALDDEERRPVEHFLGLRGQWRSETRLAMRAAVCAELERRDGESAEAAAKRLRRKMIGDRHDALRIANGGKVPSTRTIKRMLESQ